MEHPEERRRAEREVSTEEKGSERPKGLAGDTCQARIWGAYCQHPVEGEADWQVPKPCGWVTPRWCLCPQGGRKEGFTLRMG